MTDPGLLAAIIERPDSDVPRLIFADWLDENEQHDRAEFIRVQCEAAPLEKKNHCNYTGSERHCDKCYRLMQLRRRERELLGKVVRPDGQRQWAKWEREVIGQLPSSHSHGGHFMRRGFVEEITCSWDDWRQHADAIRAATPLKKVRLTDFPPHEWQMRNIPPNWPLGQPDGYVALDALRHIYPGIEFELLPISAEELERYDHRRRQAVREYTQRFEEVFYGQPARGSPRSG